MRGKKKGGEREREVKEKKEKIRLVGVWWVWGKIKRREKTVWMTPQSHP